MTYDGQKENFFLVWKQDRIPRRFVLGQRGFYYCNLNEVDGKIFITIDTMDDNKTNYTQRQIRFAESSRKFQNTIGVTTQGLIQVVNQK